MRLGPMIGGILAVNGWGVGYAFYIDLVGLWVGALGFVVGIVVGSRGVREKALYRGDVCGLFVMEYVHCMMGLSDVLEKDNDS